MSILDILDLDAPRQFVPKERTKGRERPHIEVVPDTTRVAPAAPSRAPFALLVLAILGIGLVGLLMLNTNLQQGAFQIHALEASTAKLGEREAVLEQKVAGLQAPERLAERAKALGMVPNEHPGFLRTEKGTVAGNPKPAEAPPPPAPPEQPKQQKQQQEQQEQQQQLQQQQQQQQRTSEEEGAPEAGRADE